MRTRLHRLRLLSGRASVITNEESHTKKVIFHPKMMPSIVIADPELTVGLLPSSSWTAGDFTTRTGIRHLPNLPTEEVFTTPDPERTEGHVTSTRPLVLKDGTIIRGLRVRFEGGRAVEVDADENAVAIRAQTSFDPGAARLGEGGLPDLGRQDDRRVQADDIIT